MENEIFGYCKIKEGENNRLILIGNNDEIEFNFSSNSKVKQKFVISKEDFDRAVKEYIKINL